MRQLVHACAAILLFVLGTAAAAHAQLRAEILASGFTSPVAIVPDPVIPGTFHIVQQDGLIRVVSNGVVRSTPLLDLRAEVTPAPRGERGLLGLAFDPRDPARLFVNFTNRTGNGDTVIARFRRSPSEPLVADPASRVDLQWSDGLRTIQQPYANHKGGNLIFGPDGYLYIGLGDGGSGNDPPNNAQTPGTLLGKMLRVDVSVNDSDPAGVRVPPTNPFVGIAGVRPEIWAFGLRNPWRYSFDDFGAGATNGMFIGDVGQGAREEIDFEPAGRGGRNYGWSVREGSIPTPGVSRTPAYGPLIGPFAEYDPTVGRSVTGGFVYRGSALGPAYRGRYFLADFVRGRIWSLGFTVTGSGEAVVTSVLEHTVELGTPTAVSTFGRGLDGELYFASFNGSVYRITTDARPPAVPTGLTATVTGSSVSLSWTAGSGGGQTASYLIDVGSTSGRSDLVTFPAGATSFSTGGVPNGRYFVRVRGVNANGASQPSSEVEVRVGCGPALPAPAEPSAQVSGRTVALSWPAVPGATGYRLEAGFASGQSNAAVLTVTSTSLTTTAPPGTFFVRVRALDACGPGIASADAVVTIR